jgi:hypothetical protein
MDVAVDSSGRILVVDYLNQHVVILNQQGKVIGTIGRKGDGPGEFRLPFRASVAADGMIYVLDLYQGRVSEFDPQHNFVRSMLLQPMLTAQHFAVSGDTIYIAGSERLGDRSPGVLHLFNRIDGRRIHSLGRLLPARTPRAMYEVGAGPILVGAGGEIWYATPGPYRLERYDATGRLTFSADRPNDFLPPAENAFVTTEVDGRTHHSVRRQPKMHSLSFGTDGRLRLAVRMLDGRFVVDEYEISGSGAGRKAQLRSSTIRPGPYLTPNTMARPGVYVLDQQDEEGIWSLFMVRVRPQRLR